MKKWTSFTVACLATVAMAACADDDPYGDPYDADPYAEAGDPTAGAERPVVPGMPGADVDRNFVEDTLTSGAKEIELSRLAEDKASNADVKAFAQQLIRDHQQANDGLRRAMTQQTANITANPEDVQDARDRLADLSGEEFDREYIDMMVEDHEQAVRRVEDRMNASGGDAQIQQWASSTLPKLRQHLERARQIQEQIKG
jgi:putative membrane protein